VLHDPPGPAVDAEMLRVSHFERHVGLVKSGWRPALVKRRGPKIRAF